MYIIHFASREQIEPLFEVFTTLERVPSAIGGTDWCTPNWLQAMLEFARPQGSAQHFPALN